MLQAPVQGLVIHGAAHFSRNAPAVWDVVPNADRIVVVIEPIGYGVEELLRLFSPFPIHLLESCIEHQSATRRQPELGAIGASDELGPLFALVALRFELIDAFVECLEEVGILDLGGFAIGAYRIGEVFVIGVQGHHFVGGKRFPIGQKPFDAEDHEVSMAFFDDARLPNRLMIHPRWQCFCQSQLHAQLLACCILAQSKGECASAKRVTFPGFIVLKGEPGALPGAKLGPVDDVGSPPMFAILVVPDGEGSPQGRIFEDRRVDYFEKRMLAFQTRNQVAQAPLGVEGQAHLLVLRFSILLAQGIGLL